ncbi:hypothetical protein CTA2_2719 [Colletotrichum tanaceti]|uniref:Uncharacterized protein n=1 Tax=Colletotrichum tanaceti TaxID=1306861 RepID=A0A4U6XID5_9PEZI|nr:hypothetical protein CTA2_2719 [Colletotrichum tanaceti]TKW55414.1 hypothetical protein CTA1_9514 [Colletotrichum tanaceti]
MSTRSAPASDQHPEAPSFRIAPKSGERTFEAFGRKATLSSRLKAVASSGERTLEERRLVQLERRTLKESGDYLGVTGINPSTGELDVLTPSTTSFSSASWALDPKPVSRQKTLPINDRRGAIVLTEEVTQKLQQQEEQRFAQKDREKEAIRQAQRNVRWQRNRQHWSSAKEPVLSPIAQSIKSNSTRAITLKRLLLTGAKDGGRDFPQPQEIHHSNRPAMDHADPRSHLPRHLISEDDGADSSDTVVRTPQRRRSSFAAPGIRELMGSGAAFGHERDLALEQVPVGAVSSAPGISVGSPQVQTTPPTLVAKQKTKGDQTDHSRVIRQKQRAHQEFEVLSSDKVPRDRSLGIGSRLVAEHQLDLNNQEATEICGPGAPVTISPFESWLTFQRASAALKTWNGGSMARTPSQRPLNASLQMTAGFPNMANRPFVDQPVDQDATETNEEQTCLLDQRGMKGPAARPAIIPITTTTGFNQGHFRLSPCQSQPEKKASENWSMLQNRHNSRRRGEQMSTSTEEIMMESTRLLANVKRRTETLVPKGKLGAAAQNGQKAAMQTEAGKSFVESSSGNEMEEKQTENGVMSPTSMSTSLLIVQEEAVQRDQSKAASLRAARAAAVHSGSKMAGTQKMCLGASKDSRALPLSLRKPRTDHVPFRRLRSSFNLVVRRSDKSQQRSNSQAIRTQQSREWPATSQTTSSKTGCSTSSTLAGRGSEGGDIEGRLRRRTIHKRMLKCATDGKQMAGIWARWYWGLISPCFDPTSPARKRLDGNESTWRDFGLFLFAASSGFILLAVAVRTAQGIALVMHTVQGVLGGLIAILGS